MSAWNNTVERAYQLAGSGEFTSLEEVRARLKAEGCDQVVGHLSGRSIQHDLRQLLARLKSRPTDRRRRAVATPEREIL